MALPSLNIGAGRTPRVRNQINCDLYPGSDIDVVMDACKPWPFEDNSISGICANHVLEHLPDPQVFFREAWRVLVPSNLTQLQIALPYGASSDAIADLTHLRMWMPGSFCCFQPGYSAEIRNPQHAEWQWPFSVDVLYLQIDPELRWLLKPGIRWLGNRLIPFLWGGYKEIWLGMRALKTTEAVDKWLKTNKGNEVPIATRMAEHDYKNRPLGEGEERRWKFFGENAKVMQHAYDCGIWV